MEGVPVRSRSTWAVLLQGSGATPLLLVPVPSVQPGWLSPVSKGLSPEAVGSGSGGILPSSLSCLRIYSTNKMVSLVVMKRAWLPAAWEGAGLSDSH